MLISKQAQGIASFQTHNLYLFSAHFDAETYRSLDGPFKPRLFSYLLTAPFIELREEAGLPFLPGNMVRSVFERLVATWSFIWFFAVLLLFLATDRPLLNMFGTAAAVSFAYSLQGMVYPYDLPALFFATLVCLLVQRGFSKWLPLALGLGTGFKETIAVFSVLPFFLDGPRKERLRDLAICLLACYFVWTAIDLYSPGDFAGLEAVTSAEDAQSASRWKLFLNARLALIPSNLFLFLNAGLALPIFFLPTGGDRLAQGFRAVAILFAAGLFLFAQVTEFRVWFELIPLCLYSVQRFLDREGATAPL